MTKIDVLLGLQWGDEGKGKVVDVITPRYDVVARFQGGPNAGHTLEFDGRKVVLRSIPSGVFQPDTVNLIGSGVVLDPVLFKAEAQDLIDGGLDLKKILRISRKTHLITPGHRLLDAASEKAKGDRKIGTTGKGIGPAYTDKVSRNGMRVGDLEGDYVKTLAAVTERQNAILARSGAERVPQQKIDEWLEAAAFLKDFEFVDSEYYVNNALNAGRRVLAEGAQGTMLDIDFGSYPFVTSSNTVSAGACIGLGVAPSRIGDVFGIFKAYCTRVGAGPFPTELFDEDGRTIRDRGHEYGAVTGRERRCGWIDLVALRYAVMINGVTKLIMMKSDVLDCFDTIRACTAYEIDGKITRDFPFNAETAGIRPVYTDIPGWKSDLTACDSEAGMPKEFLSYVAFIEEQLGVPVAILSVGPDRKQTILRRAFYE